MLDNQGFDLWANDYDKTVKTKLQADILQKLQTKEYIIIDVQRKNNYEKYIFDK